ncbi:hypothetical protein [Sphingomicrobium nitratireducens]|uniref:hypothetical protein n=1 Tax=Sphingomicrobium nitratireducens TaxID=2964666 RepID=UPI00223F7E9E|nr:hypothetical protein [Sphingomicrobium nitratireducens]
MTRFLVAILAALSLTACAGTGGGLGTGGYGLVRVKEQDVGSGRMHVTPPREWSRMSSRILTDVRAVEDWTLNGPYLDTLSFVTGLKDGKNLVWQQKRDTRQVPPFEAGMTAPEVAAMLETFYRTRTGTIDFRTLELKPRTWMGTPGFQFDFEHLDGDELWRQGRAVGAEIDGRLYLVLLDAERSHYFGEALPDFEAIVESARLTP